MITAVLYGFGLLIIIAVIVGIEEAMNAPSRRILASERRLRWEARHLSADDHGLAYDSEEDCT